MPGRRASAWLPEERSHLEHEGAGRGAGSCQGTASKLGPAWSPGSPAARRELGTETHAGWARCPGAEGTPGPRRGPASHTGTGNGRAQNQSLGPAKSAPSMERGLGHGAASTPTAQARAASRPDARSEFRSTPFSGARRALQEFLLLETLHSGSAASARGRPTSSPGTPLRLRVLGRPLDVAPYKV